MSRLDFWNQHKYWDLDYIKKAYGYSYDLNENTYPHWLITRVQELESWLVVSTHFQVMLRKENRRYKQELEYMKQHCEEKMQAYRDRYGASYDIERYDETREFVDWIEQILEGEE